MRESSVQAKGRKLILLAGGVPVKVGFDGWPDYLVLIGNGQHFWVEWKAPGGRLRPNQKVRIEHLRAAGDTVYVLDNADDVLTPLAGAFRPVPVPATRYRENGE